LVNRDVLSNARYTAETIWTDWSVELMQLLISSVWLAAFVFLSGLIGPSWYSKRRLHPRAAVLPEQELCPDTWCSIARCRIMRVGTF
jgi:hypothetical protein